MVVTKARGSLESPSGQAPCPCRVCPLPGDRRAPSWSDSLGCDRKCARTLESTRCRPLHWAQVGRTEAEEPPSSLSVCGKQGPVGGEVDAGTPESSRTGEELRLSVCGDVAGRLSEGQPRLSFYYWLPSQCQGQGRDIGSPGQGSAPETPGGMTSCWEKVVGTGQPCRLVPRRLAASTGHRIEPRG